ncbi:MAG: right-handed parallel beta-helix repeat-containing protein [Planctomycetes bacterium]|nr:right-handed parallel beta-helix repeat-containing protein [Planctomycetota bacterium]
MPRSRLAALFFLLVALVPRAARAGDATVPGEVTLPYPTLVHLSIEWEVVGDDDCDGVVAVRFRATGERSWRDGMPLRRVPAGRGQETEVPFEWKNRHAGSLFGLAPGTEYEIELALVDPDGGSARRSVRARTRPVPRAMPGARIRRAGPANLEATAAGAAPGDVILLAAGRYGEFAAPRDGEPGKPIVYRADGEAVFERVYLTDRKHVHVEGLVVEGSIELLGAEECAVRRCVVRTGERDHGIGARSKPGCTNCYIADNVVEGTTPWTSEAMGANGKNFGEGIEITGPGNVICHNRVSGFRDCISTMEDGGAALQVSIDIYGNDISIGADDGIEADFCMGNCRIVGNRLTNCFTGLSSQPGLGGPTYFIRNAMYNLAYVPFKLHRYSTGDVFLHNTVVKVGDGMACFASQPFDRALFRNNLCIGGPGGAGWGGYGAGDGLAACLEAPGPACDFDFDALGTHGTPFAGKFGGQRFSSLAELRRGPHEMHAVQVGLDAFRGVEFPDPPVPTRDPPDLRPRPGSAVVDAACPIPNVNDRFAGRGPDIGAYEAGEPLPLYGPRPEGVDEETSARRR